jgi:hypothetical protein
VVRKAVAAGSPLLPAKHKSGKGTGSKAAKPRAIAVTAHAAKPAAVHQLALDSPVKAAPAAQAVPTPAAAQQAAA